MIIARPLLGLATAGALLVRPSVSLRPDRTRIDAPPDAILARLHDRFAGGPDVLVVSEHRIVRRFAGRAGAFSYRTIELVTFARDAVVFDHLNGPFAACHERLELEAQGPSTVLTHSGTFSLRGGLWTFAGLGLAVRRAFEVHVRHHLDELAIELDGAG